MSLTGAYQNSPAHSRWAAFWLRRGARFRRPEAVAILMPSRGGLARRWNGSCGLTAACLFPVPVPYESKLSTGPKPKTAGCFRNQLPFIVLRRERDSNSRYPFGVHTLSRRASSATRASLQYVSGTFRSKPDCKGSKKIRKSHNSGKNLRDFVKWRWQGSCKRT